MPAKGVNWPVLLGFWLLVCIALVLRTSLLAGSLPLYADTDDAMRMVTATDLLDGQSWQDGIEHRDNTPFGASMHWSRLVDAPIAGLIFVFRPFAGAAATDWAATAWPLLLLLALLVMCTRLCARFAGPEGNLPAMILPILTLPVIVEFLPGRVDHHSVQILLTLGLLEASLAGRDSVRWAAAAGVLAATSIAIGIETIVTVVIAIVVFASYGIAEPARSRRPALAFGIAFGLATPAHLLLAAPPSLYFTPACDALSFTYASGALLCGLSFVLAIGLGARLVGAGQRLALFAALGGVAGAVALALSPQCLGGPYAGVPPELARAFFPSVGEARSLFEWGAEQPIVGFSFAASSLAGALVMIWCVIQQRRDRRVEWAVLLAFTLGGLLIATMQIRGLRMTGALAIPAGAWFIAGARCRLSVRPVLREGLALGGAWLAFAGLLQMGAGAILATGLDRLMLGGVATAPGGAPAETVTDPRGYCFRPSIYDKLAALPPGRVITPVDTGALVLRYTPHSVVAAGYHRNSAGMLDNFHFFNSDEATAEQIARKRGLDYVVLCKPLPARFERERATASSFSVTFEKGRIWPWLLRLTDPDDPLQIFRIDLAATAEGAGRRGGPEPAAHEPAEAQRE